MNGDPEEYRRRVYSDYAASVDPALRGTGPADPAAREEVYERDFLPLLPADRGARILDAGCGRGEFLLFLKKRGFTNVAGVDRSPESVKAARAAGLSDVGEGSVEAHLAAHPGAYDCVVAVDVLEHLFKDEVLKFLDAAHAALKPGGRLIVQTVNAASLFGGRMLNIDFTHETAFTRHSLHQAFGAAGFADADFHEIRPVGAGPRAALRRLLWKVFRLKLSLYLHVETGSGILRNDHLFSQIFLARARKRA
jgi:2-polyprenyl-3-methyl-5-hydroxy-6-metoxy-1,4-benzoquinol methylase